MRRNRLLWVSSPREDTGLHEIAYDSKTVLTAGLELATTHTRLVCVKDNWKTIHDDRLCTEHNSHRRKPTVHCPPCGFLLGTNSFHSRSHCECPRIHQSSVNPPRLVGTIIRRRDTVVVNRITSRTQSSYVDVTLNVKQVRCLRAMAIMKG